MPRAIVTEKRNFVGELQAASGFFAGCQSVVQTTDVILSSLEDQCTFSLHAFLMIDDDY